MTSLEDRYIATLVLHAVGDTLGFKNGEWEFNYGQKKVGLEMTLELLYDFISLGGISDINLKGWNVSDDTMFHLGVAESLIAINIKNDLEPLYKDMIENFIGIVNDMIATAGVKDRWIGKTTRQSITKIHKTKQDARRWSYDSESGGNGGAMRTSCIGLAFNGKENRDKLIEIAVTSTKITHNSPIGWLGGLTSALFTAFAIEGINLHEWAFLMLELVESDKVRKYLNPESPSYDEEQEDYEEYVRYWKRYLDMRFVDGNPITTRSHTNIIYRSKYHFTNFTQGTRGIVPGDSGYSATIMAYDSLLDCNSSWETLIIYSAIHWGDSDTVGCIAASWFGAIHGFKNIPSSNLEHLEYKKELYNAGKKLYAKFFLGEKVKL